MRLAGILRGTVTTLVLNKVQVGKVGKHQANQFWVGFGRVEGIVQKCVPCINVDFDGHADLIDQIVHNRYQHVAAC